VGEDDRGRGDVQGVAHRFRGNVRQVDEHADPLHLADDLTAEIGEAPSGRIVGRRIGPGQVAVVRECHVPDAERVKRPEDAERGGDRMPALGAEQGRDLATGEDPLDVRRGQC